jgi:hypothetical protein
MEHKFFTKPEHYLGHKPLRQAVVIIIPGNKTVAKFYADRMRGHITGGFCKNV